MYFFGIWTGPDSKFETYSCCIWTCSKKLLKNIHQSRFENVNFLYSYWCFLDPDKYDQANSFSWAIIFSRHTFRVPSPPSPPPIEPIELGLLGLSPSLLGGRVAGLPQLLPGPGHPQTRMHKAFQRGTSPLLDGVQVQLWVQCRSLSLTLDLQNT